MRYCRLKIAFSLQCLIKIEIFVNLVRSVSSTYFYLGKPLNLYLSFFRIMRKPLRGIGRALLFCMGFHWIKVKGKLSSSAEAPILAVAPHSSFVDAVALSVVCISSGVSRKENDSIPLIGGLLLIIKCLNIQYCKWASGIRKTFSCTEQ